MPGTISHCQATRISGILPGVFSASVFESYCGWVFKRLLTWKFTREQEFDRSVAVRVVSGYCTWSSHRCMPAHSLLALESCCLLIWYAPFIPAGGIDTTVIPNIHYESHNWHILRSYRVYNDGITLRLPCDYFFCGYIIRTEEGKDRLNCFMYSNWNIFAFWMFLYSQRGSVGVKVFHSRSKPESGRSNLAWVGRLRRSQL